jgi:sulfur carrier protein ThiS
MTTATTIFVDGQIIRDRAHLADPVHESSRIYVFQALSGGQYPLVD